MFLFISPDITLEPLLFYVQKLQLICLLESFPFVIAMYLVVSITSLASMVIALYTICHGPQCIVCVLYDTKHIEEATK